MSLSKKNVNEAITQAENRRNQRYACPRCKRPKALLITSHCGLTIVRHCRFCPFVHYVADVENKKK